MLVIGINHNNIHNGEDMSLANSTALLQEIKVGFVSYLMFVIKFNTKKVC